VTLQAPPPSTCQAIEDALAPVEDYLQALLRRVYSLRQATCPACLHRQQTDTLRDRRMRLGLTQTQVAALADLSRQYVTDIESGRRTSPNARALLDALLSQHERQRGWIVRTP
jgi:DNA-binding XRE family transcriptional regulator